ncbi:hypothetical protein DY000_02023100 [Brassica cretica]|uniref:EXS domain-containing protein n=1 Tax=Brassica cretica TaxID=69181 RepID=A0ABQ7EBF9_BRACR|nr:hypothetical protein DY000_02023100 [Brassica cretica]
MLASLVALGIVFSFVYALWDWKVVSGLKLEFCFLSGWFSFSRVANTFYGKRR